MRGDGSVVILLLVAGWSFGQKDESFKNLKVFPKDIKRAELMDHMRGYTRALGVRCIHCHVRPPGGSFKDTDWAADDKKPKRVARVMIEMVRTMNEGSLKELKIEASCTTCHRGISQPRPLEQVLAETDAEQGLDGALLHYTKLRQRYHGRDSYNFSAESLNRWSMMLLEQGRMDDAARVQSLNVGMFPDFGMGHVQLGGHALLKEKRKLASDHFDQALHLNERSAMHWIAGVANFLKKQERDQVGIRAMELLVELRPNQARPYRLLADFHRELGDSDNAKIHYRKALAIDPENRRAKRGLAMLKP